MILEKKESRQFDGSLPNTFINTDILLTILKERNQFRSELIDLFQVDEENSKPINIGNVKFLIESLNKIDSICKKIDIQAEVKDFHLIKMLEEEKAIFEINSLNNPFILKENKSDTLRVETRYSAKGDLLDIYNFSKFANYCRDQEFEDLVDNIKEYLKHKNLDNTIEKSLRLVYKYDEKKYYLRAVTSSDGYKDFGINFSVFVALMALSDYTLETSNDVYISDYSVDESSLYVSFTLSDEIEISKNLFLSFNLTLENDEIKRSSVSFNGVFKIRFEDKGRSSEIYLKPYGIKQDKFTHPVELLTYQHRGSVEKVLEKLEELPSLINFFINQVSEDAGKIANIKHPDDVRKLIHTKIKNARKPEFLAYKEQVKSKLASVTVDNIFSLFELLKQVEMLFEHDDVISRDFWRNKLYESLIDKK